MNVIKEVSSKENVTQVKNYALVLNLRRDEEDEVKIVKNKSFLGHG
ncbi:hypothetical protein C5167_032987 [Papaver somniferum]|uniref:Uncharacterized protein n=1 Tax=Papaver somniferum TaxID=3469 RepID=A0A4Y7KD46_PAPSO|nr:hypothetical protein C5167_032987 [Papaver somniferum]